MEKRRNPTSLLIRDNHAEHARLFLPICIVSQSLVMAPLLSLLLSMTMDISYCRTPHSALVKKINI